MNRLSEPARRVRPELADMLVVANSSDNSNQVPERFLTSGQLDRSL